MDARRKSRLINEAHDYVWDNWIYTEPFIKKVSNEIANIKTDNDLSREDKEKLISLKEILNDIDKDRPGIEIEWPSWTTKQIEKSDIALPMEMQKAIFSKLPFSERHRLAIVSTAWHTFFNEQPIEKKYLIPKKSGGLIFFTNHQTPAILSELLSGAGDDLKEDLTKELFNGLTIKNKREIEGLERNLSEGVSAYYASWIPLGFAILCSYYLDSNSLFYGALSILLLPLIIAPLHQSEVQSLSNEPKEARQSLENYLGSFKKI